MHFNTHFKTCELIHFTTLHNIFILKMFPDILENVTASIKGKKTSWINWAYLNTCLLGSRDKVSYKVLNLFYTHKHVFLLQIIRIIHMTIILHG